MCCAIVSPVPLPIPGLTAVRAIAAQGATGYALRSDGTVWAWGEGDSGELGNGADRYSTVPVRVSGLSGVTAIAAGAYTGYALRGDGTVWAWGDGSHGALGDGDTVGSPVPVRVSGLRGITAVGGGLSTGYATSGDEVWAWGWGFFGQFGDGTLGEDSAVPVRVSGLNDATAVVANSHTGYALSPDGGVWAWGDSEDGQLGNGDTGESAVPVQVPGFAGSLRSPQAATPATRSAATAPCGPGDREPAASWAPAAPPTPRHPHPSPASPTSAPSRVATKPATPSPADPPRLGNSAGVGLGFGARQPPFDPHRAMQIKAGACTQQPLSEN